MLRGIGAATIWQIFSLFVGLGDRIVLSSLLIRTWGVATFEDWSVLLAYANFLSFLDLGLQLTLGNSISLARRDGDDALYRKRIGFALFFATAMLLVGSVAIFVFAFVPHAADFVTTTQITGWDRKAVLIAMSFAVLLQTCAFVATALYRAAGRLDRSLAGTSILGMVRTVTMGVMVVLAFGPVGVALVYLAHTALFALVFLPMDQSWHRAGQRIGAVRPRRRELAEIASKSMYFALQQGCQILLLSMPLVVLSRTAAATSDNAIFVWLRMLLNSVRQVISALANSISIELARVDPGPDSAAQLRGHMVRFTRVICLVNSALLGVIFSLGEPFIRLWSGGTLTYDRAMALMLTLGLLVSGPFIVINNYLTYIDNARIGALSRVLSVGLFATTALAFSGSMTGVVAGLSLGEALTAGLFFLPALARACETSAVRLGLHLARYSMAGFGLVVICNAVTTMLPVPSPIAGFLLQMSVVGTAALVAMLLFGMTGRDRLLLWHHVSTALRALVGGRRRTSHPG